MQLFLHSQSLTSFWRVGQTMSDSDLWLQATLCQWWKWRWIQTLIKTGKRGRNWALPSELQKELAEVDLWPLSHISMLQTTVSKCISQLRHYVSELNGDNSRRMKLVCSRGSWELLFLPPPQGLCPGEGVGGLMALFRLLAHQAASQDSAPVERFPLAWNPISIFFLLMISLKLLVIVSWIIKRACRSTLRCVTLSKCLWASGACCWGREASQWCESEQNPPPLLPNWSEAHPD